MKRKPPPPKPSAIIAVCRVCGDLIETNETDRDRCYCCRKRAMPVVPPQAKDDPDAFGRKEPE